MNIQVKKAFLLCFATFFSLHCGDKDGFSVPTSTTEPSDDSVSTGIDCQMSWTEENGLWIDPKLCVAWSSKSDWMTWFEAVGSADIPWANESFDESSTNYCADLQEGGLKNWRVPTLTELKDMSIRTPPFEDLADELWTSTMDQGSNLMWTINLEQPGMELLLAPDEMAAVRCVHDL